MPTTPGSSVPRRQLGRALKSARLEARLTVREAATLLEWSEVKIWRIETGRVALRSHDIRAMCESYGLDATTTEKYAGMAPLTKVQGWWNAYGDVIPEGFDLYLGLEEVATGVNMYQPERVPGLLQIPDYVRALRLDQTDEEIEKKIELRRERQARITRSATPARLNVALNEAVLRRPVGGAPVMSAQLRYLAELSELPNVEIRIVRYAAGFHPGILTGPFVVLHFPERADGIEVEPPTVYIEGLTGELWLDQEHEVAGYERVFQEILVAAGDPSGYKSRDMLWRATMEVE